VYNDAGLLTSATNPENGTVTYTYSADNTLQYKHDAKGQDTVYTYDSKKRVTMVQRYPAGKNNAEDTCQQVTYSYDTNPYNSTFSQNPKGRLTATKYYAGNCPAGVGQSITEMYSYNPPGQVNWKSLQAGTATAQTVNYEYDISGRLTYMGYPAPGLVELSYGYDGMGRPNSLSVPGATGYWVQNAQYDVAGRMNSMQYAAVPGGAYTLETMTYNVNGQLASLNWGVAPGSSGYTGPAGGIQYSYSATQNNGQITQAVDTLSGETIGYLYDALKRLTSATSTPISGSSTAPWTQTFQYDGFGNLTAKVLNGATTPIAVNAATNQLSSVYYDANGNMTSGAGATLTYDVSNRLASAVETSGGIEYYGYAPDNKRVFQQTASGHQLITLYGTQGEKLSVFDLTANAWVATYVWFGGKLISDGNAVYGDRLGTNRASGARFMPYGDEITSTTNDHVKFGTYTRDSYTGLDYAGARYYASSYGNFSSPDPSMDNVDYQNPVSWNAYSYTNGDPINSNDPNGLDTVGLPNPSPNVYNCSSDFIYTASLAGETINQFFNSNEGVLGMMSYFEQEGSGSSADQKVWAALDWTFENQWNLSASDKNWFYGPGNAPSSLIATITTGSGRSQVFTSTGQLTANFNTQLLNTLTGKENSSQCAGLEQAFDVAAGVITGAGNLKNGITPIPDPVPGALQFASNGAVPTHSPYVTQGSLPSITDGNNTWTFFTDTYTPPVRRPRPPRRGGKRPL